MELLCSSILLLVANGSSQLHKMYQTWCTAKTSWWWAESLPETCRVVVPIKLEFSAYVGFIHKEVKSVWNDLLYWIHWTLWSLALIYFQYKLSSYLSGTRCTQYKNQTLILYREMIANFLHHQTKHVYFVFPGATQPIVGVYFRALYRASPSSRTRLLDHTQRRATVGRTPLNEWWVRPRDLYLATHNTHNRQTSMPPVGFEPTIAAGERP